MNPSRLVKTLSIKQLSLERNPLFAIILTKHIQKILRGDIDVRLYDENHPAFEVRNSSSMTTYPRVEPKNREKERRVELPTKSFVVGMDKQDGLVVCHARYRQVGSMLIKEKADKEKLQLLFDYNKNTIFCRTAFLTGEGCEQFSPLRDFERTRLHIQRALGKYVHYWAIVNKGYAKQHPEEVDRFERAGNTLVRLDLTIKDVRDCYGAAKKRLEKKKTKAHAIASRRFR